MTLIIGHLADLHIGTTKYNTSLVLPPGYKEKTGIEEHAGLLASDIAYMLSESLTKLSEEGVRIIVLSGDIFDVPKPVNRELAWAAKFFKQWTSKGMRFIVIAGDHDTPGLRDATPLETLANTIDGFYYPPTREALRFMGRNALYIELDEGVFFTTPFFKHTREKRAEITRKINKIYTLMSEKSSSKPKILLAHYGLTGYTHSEDALLNPEELPPVDYAAMGHVHQRHIVIDNPSGPSFAYPGSLVPLSTKEIRDSTRKGVNRGPLLVSIEPGGKPDIREIVIKPRRAYLTASTLMEDIEETVAKLLRGTPRASLGEPPLVHLEIKVRNAGEASKRNLRMLLESVAREYNVILRVASLTPLIEDKTEKIEFENIESLENIDREIELTVIASRLSGNRDIAKLVLELKNHLVMGEDEEAVKIIEELASKRYMNFWQKLLKTPTPQAKTQVTKVRSKQKKTEAKPRKPKARKLLDFLDR